MDNNSIYSNGNELYKIEYTKEDLEKLKKLKYLKYGSYFLMSTSFAILLKYWGYDSNTLLDGISSTSLMLLSVIDRIYCIHKEEEIDNDCKKRVL